MCIRLVTFFSLPVWDPGNIAIGLRFLLESVYRWCQWYCDKTEPCKYFFLPFRISYRIRILSTYQKFSLTWFYTKCPMHWDSPVRSLRSKGKIQAAFLYRAVAAGPVYSYIVRFQPSPDHDPISAIARPDAHATPQSTQVSCWNLRDGCERCDRTVPRVFLPTAFLSYDYR